MNSNRTAVYAGSFDIPTFGHLQIIERGARLYDKLFVLVAYNAQKKGGTFAPDERVAMLKSIVGQLPNVEVATVDRGLTALWAKQNGAGILLRAMRNGDDFEKEREIALANGRIDPEIETILLMTTPDNLCVSSSLVREIMTTTGWESQVGKFVPEPVWAALVERKSGRRRLADWLTMWRRLGARQAPVTDILEEYDRLVEHYAGRHDQPRAYHNLDHVLALLDVLEPCWRLMKDPDIVRLAVWYHDFVYRVGSQTNETDSAVELERAVKRLTPRGGWTDFGALATEYVEATRHHQHSALDADYLLDADLVSLGVPWPQFNDYRQKIRQEYSQYDETQYRAGTAAFCRDMLQRKYIYLTPEFRARYESQARLNLEALLDSYDPDRQADHQASSQPRSIHDFPK